MRSILSFVTAVLSIFFVTARSSTIRDVFQKGDRTTPPPKPEPIEIIEVPLPPSLANTTEGACTPAINPRRTGCIAPTGLNSGNFMPDGLHVTASVTFVGAPASPDPANVYNGLQFILLKADGTTFPNGDTWKCISCGVPDANKVGSTELGEYPQTFVDGTKAMSGVNIIDCGMAQLTSEDCKPNKTYIYPIRLSNEANDDGSGPGFPLRELRLHPDNVHLTFNTFAETSSGLGEVGFFGRLQFNETGSRYDLINVTILNPPELVRPIFAEGKQLIVNRSAITIGELRGLTGTGKEVVYVGYPYESCNIDLFAVSLATGAVRRITAHPEYADPIGVSPDDKWQVVLDTRGSGRLMFLSGLRSVPPITDLVTVTASSSVRNNGNRRFFEPYLLDYEGDRGEYFGQKINAAGNGSPGSINDPNWNAGADPRWSLDGTRVVYFQWLAIPPACGGSNPLLCETSPYADGQEERVMIATFTNRKPLPIKSVAEAPDDIPWGTKYIPGMTLTAAEITVPAGEYTLQGNSFGYAHVSITLNNANTALQTVSVAYHQFSDDGINFVAGYENVTLTPVNITLNRWDWFSNITSTGPVSGTKVTNWDGFHMEIDEVWNFFEANGTLTTTIDGVSYRQPCNYC